MYGKRYNYLETQENNISLIQARNVCGEDRHYCMYLNTMKATRKHILHQARQPHTPHDNIEYNFTTSQKLT